MKVKYIILSLVLPLIIMANTICNDGIKKYYDEEFINSSIFLKTCINDKKVTQTDKIKAKFYLGNMELYQQIPQSKLSNKYMQDVMQKDKIYRYYLVSLAMSYKQNYKKSATYYRNIIDSSIILNKNYKIKPIHNKILNINAIFSDRKGKPHKINLKVLSLNNHNISKIKDKIIKNLLAYSMEDIKKNPQSIVFNYNYTFDNSLDLISFTIEDNKSILINNKITTSTLNNFYDIYSLADIYFQDKKYKRATVLLKYIVDDILYKKIYKDDINFNSIKKQNIITLHIKNQIESIGDKKHIYEVKLDISLELLKNQIIDNVTIKNIILKVISNWSTEEIQTVGGFVLFKEDLIETINKQSKTKILKDLFIINYEIYKVK